MNSNVGNRGPIVCVVGARPNFMKMAPLLRALRARSDLPPSLLLHTGQHYDARMKDNVFDSPVRINGSDSW